MTILGSKDYFIGAPYSCHFITTIILFGANHRVVKHTFTTHQELQNVGNWFSISALQGQLQAERLKSVGDLRVDVPLEVRI